MKENIARVIGVLLVGGLLSWEISGWMTDWISSTFDVQARMMPTFAFVFATIVLVPFYFVVHSDG